MQTVKIFVEWDHAEVGIANAIAVFYGGRGEGLAFKGVLPQKAGQVTILSMKRICEIKMRRFTSKKAVVILHEMAHAIHHYGFGDTNRVIDNAYGQAMTRKL